MMRANPPLKPEILTAIPTILTDKNQKPQLQATLKTPYQPIDTAFNLETALQPFQQAKIIGIDCETTGLDPYSDRKSLVNELRIRSSSSSIECWFKNTKFV